MAYLTFHVQLPDGDKCSQAIDRLYEIAVSKGFTMPDFHKGKLEGVQRGGKLIAISQLFAAIAEGKVEIK